VKLCKLSSLSFVDSRPLICVRRRVWGKNLMILGGNLMTLGGNAS